MITVVDPWHWLTEDGAFLEDPRMRNRMLRVAQFIEAGGPLPRGHTRETLVACRRRPAGKACTGLMWVLKEDDDALQAFCPTCHTAEFHIHNWEDTLWAEGPMEPVPLDTLFEPEPKPKDEPKVEQDHRSRPPQPIDDGDPLARMLVQIRSTLSAAVVRDRIATTQSPAALIDEIMASLPGPPDQHIVEQLLPILMNLWNTTPRPELGGRSPSYTHVARKPVRVEPKTGRNAPCPCGSGKKYKKCCGVNPVVA